VKGISLNQFVQKALESYVHTLPPIIPTPGGTGTKGRTTGQARGRKKKTTSAGR